MGGIATAVFEPGDRDLDDVEEALETELEAFPRDISRSVFRSDGRVVWTFKDNQSVFEETKIGVPCDRVLYLGIGDTGGWGHGILFDWDGEEYEPVEERGDEDMGESTCEHFLEEYGIRGYRGRYASRDGPFDE